MTIGIDLETLGLSEGERDRESRCWRVARIRVRVLTKSGESLRFSCSLFLFFSPFFNFCEIGMRVCERGREL